MSVSLSKGNKVSLAKEASDLGIRLTTVNVGLGWDCREDGYPAYDLDAWALAITTDGIKKKNLVFFGNKEDKSKCIIHCGDNLTGAGDGDDETIIFKLSEMPNDYLHVIIGVTIYEAKHRHQCFKDVDNTFIRIYDQQSGTEICKYSDSKIKSDYGDCTSLLFGVLSRVGDDWIFNAIGEGSKMPDISSALDIYNGYDFNTYLKPTNSDGGKKFMAVSLSKGGKVSLAKVAEDAGIAKLSKINVGLGWDVNRYDGQADFDLDASAFLCGANGKVRDDEDFIFYNKRSDVGSYQNNKWVPDEANSSIYHTGDNRTGDGEGDDELIIVDLDKVPAGIEEINFTVTINDADKNNQNFGMVENSYIRIVDAVTNTELLRYDLGEDFSIETAIVVAKLYRHNGEWKFNAVGSGFQNSLLGLCNNFGVNAE